MRYPIKVVPFSSDMATFLSVEKGSNLTFLPQGKIGLPRRMPFRLLLHRHKLKERWDGYANRQARRKKGLQCLQAGKKEKRPQTAARFSKLHSEGQQDLFLRLVRRRLQRLRPGPRRVRPHSRPQPGQLVQPLCQPVHPAAMLVPDRAQQPASAQPGCSSPRSPCPSGEREPPAVPEAAQKKAPDKDPPRANACCLEDKSLIRYHISMERR